MPISLTAGNTISTSFATEGDTDNYSKIIDGNIQIQSNGLYQILYNINLSISSATYGEYVRLTMYDNNTGSAEIDILMSHKFGKYIGILSPQTGFWNNNTLSFKLYSSQKCTIHLFYIWLQKLN